MEHKGFFSEPSECSTDEQTEAIDHFRNFGAILGELDSLPRTPSHQEALEELEMINNYLFTESYSGSVISLDENTKANIAKKEAQIEEIYQIGDFVYLYCVSFEGIEDELSSLKLTLQHCGTLKAYLSNKERYLRDKYTKAKDGEIENHHKNVALSESIILEKDRLDRLMKNIKLVEV